MDAASGHAGIGTRDERAAVLATLDRWNAGLGAGDLAATLALFADEPGVTLIGSEAAEVHTGPAALRAFLARLLARPVRYTWAWTRREAEVLGDTAWAFADGDVIATAPDGATSRGRYRITVVLTRSGGEWRWRQYHGSEAV